MCSVCMFVRGMYTGHVCVMCVCQVYVLHALCVCVDVCVECACSYVLSMHVMLV